MDTGMPAKSVWPELVRARSTQALRWAASFGRRRLELLGGQQLVPHSLHLHHK